MKPSEPRTSGRLELLRAKLGTEIPVTQPLGIRVVDFEDDQIVLWAPLEKNRNHQGTAFAGSVNALATLTGWASVWLTLADSNVQAALVIQDSSIQYSKPVKDDFRARCKLPSGPDVQRFLEAISKHGRGRIRVEVSVLTGRLEVARFEGRYVGLANG